jgi:urease accessory protein
MNKAVLGEPPFILPDAPQRGVGRLELSFRRAWPVNGDAYGVTRIERFYQEGCLKARLPRAVAAGHCEAVLMNISGGIAGGDVLQTALELGAGARACVAGQAAERVYRALGAVPAQVTTRIAVGPDASLDYLPQETILFDGFALRRTLEIELDETARYLGVESVVFGRHAMGERLGIGMLRDRITIRRNGKLLLQDMTRLDGDVAGMLGRKAVAAGAQAVATIIYASSEAAELLDDLRAALLDTGCEAGASMVEGVLVARLLAPSSDKLRRAIVKILMLCRNGQALPRVWQS